jgi:DNA-directed RNA polymerase subunit RPC12/RpoP
MRPTPTGRIPLICHQCDQPVEASDGRTLRCPHCGTFDRLPARDLERALELKRRLQRAAGSVTPLAGVELVLARLYEGRRVFMLLLVPLALVAGALSTLLLVELGPVVAHSPRVLRVPFIRQLLGGATWLGGMAMSAGLGLVLGRLHYRRAMRPRVVARPPLTPEAAPRCRACAGELGPTASRRFVRCRYCSTTSLVPRSLAAAPPDERGRRAPWPMVRVISITIAAGWMATAVLMALGR